MVIEASALTEGRAGEGHATGSTRCCLAAAAVGAVERLLVVVLVVVEGWIHRGINAFNINPVVSYLCCCT